MRGFIAFSLLLVGCSGDPASPSARAAQPDGAQAVKGSANNTSPAVAIDDALDRLLPSLDAETAKTLQGPLTAIKVALNTGNAGAVAGAAAVARAALSDPIAADDERAPDLAAISLALDATTPK
jgi:hypothetical protein